MAFKYNKLSRNIFYTIKCMSKTHIYAYFENAYYVYLVVHICAYLCICRVFSHICAYVVFAYFSIFMLIMHIYCIFLFVYSCIFLHIWYCIFLYI